MSGGKWTPGERDGAVVWQIEYNNDTGFCDEGFWEWYDVGPVRIDVMGRSDEDRAEALALAHLVRASRETARELAAATAWMIERLADEYGPRENWPARERVEAQEAALALAEGTPP